MGFCVDVFAGQPYASNSYKMDPGKVMQGLEFTGWNNNPIVQDNIKKLRKFGYEIIESDEGYLACGDVGKGKLPKESVLVEHIIRACAKEKDLIGKNILVTAGPTMEAIDPVRYITNHSTGKMGYAIARMAMLRGANVTLVTGETSIEKPMFVGFKSIATHLSLSFPASFFSS